MVVIFDIETNGVSRKLRGHTRQIQSIRYAWHKLEEKIQSLTHLTAGRGTADISSPPHKTGSASYGT